MLELKLLELRSEDLLGIDTMEDYERLIAYALSTGYFPNDPRT